MSQQSIQQAWTYQFLPSESTDHARSEKTSSAPSSLTNPGARPRLRPKIRFNSSSSVFLVATGITASLLIIGFLFLSANAQAAKTEYQRQHLVQEISRLRAENVNLRCSISEHSDLARISQVAQAAGMRPANPAGESDFFTVSDSQLHAQRARNTPAGSAKALRSSPRWGASSASRVPPAALRQAFLTLPLRVKLRISSYNLVGVALAASEGLHPEHNREVLSCGSPPPRVRINDIP